MACTKATVCKHAMMGMPLVPSSQRKSALRKGGKGKTPQIGIKRLEKMRSKAIIKLTVGRRFRPGMKALYEIWWYQKMTELLIPKLPFLQLVWEILQWEQGFHHIQAGAVLDTTWGSQGICYLLNGRYQPVCSSCKVSNDATLGHAASPKDKGGQLNNLTS